jgi:hypothetical protein
MLKRHWKAGVLVVLALAAGLLVWLAQRSPLPAPTAGSGAAPGAPTPADSSLALPQRPPLPAYRPSAPEAPPKPRAPEAPARGEPRIPPVPYRYAGMLGQQVLLAKDAAIVAVSPGEVLDQVYRVDAIDEKGVSLTYLPLGKRIVIER